MTLGVGDGQGFFGNTLQVFMWHFGCSLGAVRRFVPFTALVHGAGVGTHGLEVVIFPMPRYQMTPKYILMHDLLPVSERPLCFQYVQYAHLGSL